MLSRVPGIKKNTETKSIPTAHIIGLILHPGSTVSLGLILFCQGQSNRRATGCKQLNQTAAVLPFIPILSLLLFQIRKRSKACRGGLWENDVLVSINGKSCAGLSHATAMQIIDSSNGMLSIRVKR